MTISNELKLSELHPCSACDGPLGGIFYILESNMAIINAQEANQVLGLTQMFKGALGLAETMASEDKPVKTESELKNRLLLCNKCYVQPITIARLVEK